MKFSTENQPSPESKSRLGSPNKDKRDIKEVISHLVQGLKDGKLDEMLKTLLKEKPEAVLNFIAKIAPKDLNLGGDLKVYKIELPKEEMKEAYKEVMDKDDI